MLRDHGAGFGGLARTRRRNKRNALLLEILPEMGSFAPNQANLTECRLSDLAENAASFAY
jgi:hypothetical protein